MRGQQTANPPANDHTMAAWQGKFYSNGSDARTAPEHHKKCA
jgi:hypothetical protein